MSSDLAVKIEGLCKSYTLFKSPSDRLVQMIQAFASRFVAWRPLRRYREFHALKDVSLSIAKGETVGIIGRNGSGKSTLLQLLCGTLQPTRGSVNVSGRVAALLELGSGFHPDFTGRENVFLNASVLGLSRAQTMDRFEQIVAFADIGDFIDQPLKNYSSGMAMRLAFAVIAHVDADILVIDEALSVGDAFFTQKCMRFLRTFMKSGTVIFVSHDIEAVKALCSRVVWLDAGLVRDDGATKLVCQGYLDALLIGKSGLTEQPPISPIKLTKEVLSHQDVRQNLWREKSLANNICVMAFDSDESGIGKMGCTIVSVKLCNVDESPAAWLEGGELVRLDIKAVCHQALTSPIFGFMVKDRTGQALFGDNTWFSFMDRPLSADVGEVLTAAFTFEMPRLPAGDYTMVAAVVDGTPQENVMHHWLHDALHFQSVASNVASGLVGIPMRKITMSKVVPDLEKAK